MCVSVYIPAYNAQGSIEKSVRSILSQSCPIDEIMVIDDGSTDRTAQIAAGLGVKVLRHSRNRGIAASRNTALKAVKSEFAASIDSDCIAESRWLEECLRHFNDPRIAGVGGAMAESGHSLPDRWRAVNLRQNNWKGADSAVPFLAGCNTVYRRRALLEAGMFDERFRSHHEDSDMGRRLREKGAVLRYLPHAMVTHIKKDTLYSVMRSCWGFRHKAPPRTLSAFAGDILADCRHYVSIMLRDVRNRELRLLPIDSAYLFFQAYFSMKYFARQSRIK